MVKREVLLFIVVLVALIAVSSFLLYEVVKLNEESTALKKETGEY